MASASAAGSSKGDDVTASRARRPRVYDWNTKLHFYPDIIDAGDLSRDFIRWNSARWRSSGRRQATVSRTSGSGPHQTHGVAAQKAKTSATKVEANADEEQKKHGVEVSEEPFKRSHFVSLSLSDKRGRRTRAARRSGRRLSDPTQFDDVQADSDTQRRSAAGGKLLSSFSAFSRSDWKRQISSVRSKDARADQQRPHGSRWAMLKQITSRERTRRRREFIRQRCRRYGWEPFSGELSSQSATTSVVAEQATDTEDQAEPAAETRDAAVSRRSLPEIVVDHETFDGESGTGSSSGTDDGDSGSVDQDQMSTQKTENSSSSPSNEYFYVLHKLHHPAHPPSQRPTHAVPDLQSDRQQGSSPRRGPRPTADGTQSRQPLPESGTVIALLARSNPPVKDDLRRLLPDHTAQREVCDDLIAESSTELGRTHCSGFDAVRLSTHLPYKFTDNYQPEVSAAVWLSSVDASARQSDDALSARRRDLKGEVLRSPAVDAPPAEMKESVRESSKRRRTSSLRWNQAADVSKVFTVTGRPRTYEHESSKLTPKVSSLERRRPIVSLPDVEDAILTDNLRRYWYVSERSVLPHQPRRVPPPPPPSSRSRPRPSPASSPRPAVEPRTRSCEFRREYELADDDEGPAVLQLHGSRQDFASESFINHLTPHQRAAEMYVDEPVQQEHIVEDATSSVPLDTDKPCISAEERNVRGGAAVDGGKRSTSPTTVCHVRVTVRHRRGPRQGPDSPADSRESTPVPAIRRAGAPAKRSSPAGRRVTFSELPAAGEENDNHQPRQQAALASLWHYHETYPGVESYQRTAGQSQLNTDVPDPPRRPSSTDRCLPEVTPSVNHIRQRDDVMSPDQQGSEIPRRHAQNSLLPDDRVYCRDRQQYGMDEEDGPEQARLSIKELVQSFESMTCPYMRPPVMAKATS